MNQKNLAGIHLTKDLEDTDLAFKFDEFFQL